MPHTIVDRVVDEIERDDENTAGAQARRWYTKQLATTLGVHVGEATT
jgi:hypothetical protein